MTEPKTARCEACSGIGVMPDGDGRRLSCVACGGTGVREVVHLELHRTYQPAAVTAGAHGVKADLTSDDLALIERINSLPLRKRLVMKGMILG